MIVLLTLVAHMLLVLYMYMYMYLLKDVLLLIRILVTPASNPSFNTRSKNVCL